MPRFNFALQALKKSKKLDKYVLAELLKNQDVLKSHVFDGYDSSKVKYVDENDQEVAQGIDELIRHMDANPKNKVFLHRTFAKKFDLALEGGGAFGFAHMGTLHAMALRGIWFDRVSGTSAGAIAAALVAGGYRIDLNYKTVIDTNIPGSLTPNPKNSLNQILFDDDFRKFTDFEGDIEKVRAQIRNKDSAISRFISDHIRSGFEKHFTMDAIRGEIRLTKDSILDAYFKIQDNIIKSFLDIRSPLGGNIGDFEVASVSVKSLVRNNQDFSNLLLKIQGDAVVMLIDALLRGKGPIYDALATAIERVTESVVDKVVDFIVENIVIHDNKFNYAAYGLFRLVEFGGLWEGDFVRDWLEKHLQELNTGTGVPLDGKNGKPLIKNSRGEIANAILFKDLKIDLCIVAADMGPVNPDKPRTPQPVFFSKRTTPDYPVAEAVRRSMSLPIVFIPRKINDGYGNNPLDIIPVYQPNGLGGLKLQPLAFQYDNDKHHDHLLLDGGLFFNLPVALFRDPSSLVFDEHEDSKPLIISNINANEKASNAPDDIPPNRYPEPAASLKNIFKFFVSHLPDGSTKPYLGLTKIWRSIEYIAGYLLTEHQDSELISLIQLIPNSFFVDIPLRDPITISGSALEFASEGRLDSGNFAISKTTKKWMVKNGFDGAKEALLQFEKDSPSLAGKLKLPNELDPYNHVLKITNAKIKGVEDINRINIFSKAKLNDNCYLRSAHIVSVRSSLRLGEEFDESYLPFGLDPGGSYFPLGDHWIKIENSKENIEDISDDFIIFNINIRARVLVALDATPPFFSGINGWESSKLKIIIESETNQIQSPLNIFTKLFEKGTVKIPGPRKDSQLNNKFAYAILVRPI